MRQSILPHVNRYSRIIFFGFLSLPFSASAQGDIPISSWRLHLSYNNIREVEVTPEKVFAASESGIVIFNRQDQILNTVNKLNGLSGSAITSLSYDETNDLLLVGYEKGDLDIIQSHIITNFNRLRDAEVTTSKKINHISTTGTNAYLSTDYGVVIFDLKQLEIQETWRDLGAGGQELSVYQSTSLRDSIYLATPNGVLAGYLGDNLLDFNHWERFDQGNLSGPIRSLVSFNGKLYAAGPTGIYRLGNDNWIQEPFLDTLAIQSLSSSTANLLMITDSTIWIMSASGEISQLEDNLIKAPAVVQQDGAGNFWVGDHASGLVSDVGGNFASYLPNGPSMTTVHRMVYDQGKLFVLSGDFSPSGQPSKTPPQLNIFENGNWTTVSQPVSDLTDIAFHDGKTYLSSFGSGILVSDASGNETILNETNSPLVHTDPGKSNITALASSADGLWVANYGGNQPLHLLKSDGSWDSFSFGFPGEKNPTDIAVDGDGNVWAALNPASGGGLLTLERSSNRGYYKTDVAGNGDLPDKNVHSITADRDGYIWIGTDAGIAYFFSPAAEATKPIFDNRFLLRDEKITALEVDGGNRKWIGTEEGVWLFNPTGEVLVRHFTRENSPLLSNTILDIEIHSSTGEVFFATDKGIISYRSDAVAAGPAFEQVKIFPNPVSPGFSGTVGITGLAEGAAVKITDISGKLVWQTKANGGMATWHVRDHEGRRATTGIYLVFAISEGGRESVVGKIAVVE